jgi:hypothetical protein
MGEDRGGGEKGIFFLKSSPSLSSADSLDQPRYLILINCLFPLSEIQQVAKSLQVYWKGKKRLISCKRTIRVSESKINLSGGTISANNFLGWKKAKK